MQPVPHNLAPQLDAAADQCAHDEVLVLEPLAAQPNATSAPIAAAAPIAAPPVAAAPHDCFGDSASSSDDDAMDDTLRFVKGSATQGDVHEFAYEMLRLIRGGRKASYRLPEQIQAWAARCDKGTDKKIQEAITDGFAAAQLEGGRDSL